MKNNKWVGCSTNTSDVGYGEDFFDPNILAETSTGPFDPLIVEEKLQSELVEE